MAKFFGYLIIALLACPFGASTPAEADVSYTQERELGKQFDMMANERFPLIRDTEFVSYVNDIGKQIAARLDDSFFEYKFSVVRDRSINAFAVPGGYIYVNVGLLNNAKNDDEVAAVLGHEVAHIHAHHMARQQEKTQLINYASMLGLLAAVVQPALAPIAAAAGQAAQLKYRREFEQEADYLGVRYLRATEYDPRAMLDFFKKLEDQGSSVPSFFPPYLLSHPLTEERLNHLEAVLGTKQWEDHERAASSVRLQRLQALARARYEAPQQVLEQYDKLRTDNPKNPRAAYLYGVVALEIGRLDEASKALEESQSGAIEGSVRELGRVALRQRNPERAAVLLRQHLAENPKDGLAEVELAKALEASGDLVGAQAAYGRAVEVAPDLSTAHEGFGLSLGRSGNEGAGFYHLGLAARLSGDYKKALDQLRRAQSQLEASPKKLESARLEIEALEKYLKIEGKE